MFTDHWFAYYAKALCIVSAYCWVIRNK